MLKESRSEGQAERKDDKMFSGLVEAAKKNAFGLPMIASCKDAGEDTMKRTRNGLMAAAGKYAWPGKAAVASVGWSVL